MDRTIASVEADIFETNVNSIVLALSNGMAGNVRCPDQISLIISIVETYFVLNLTRDINA